MTRIKQISTSSQREARAYLQADDALKEFSPASLILPFCGPTLYPWRRHPLIGLRFDERAIEAAQDSKFKPATNVGEPVTVELYIGVNFQVF